MYNLYWKEISDCLIRSNVFYGTPYRLCKGIFVAITSPRYVKTCQFLYRLVWIQTGLMYLTLLQVWWKEESKNHLLVSLGVVMCYTAVTTVGFCYASMDSIRETTTLLNSWVKFQKNLIGAGTFLQGKILEIE
jgi:hypothetical protein